MSHWVWRGQSLPLAALLVSLSSCGVSVVPALSHLTAGRVRGRCRLRTWRLWLCFKNWIRPLCLPRPSGDFGCPLWCSYLPLLRGPFPAQQNLTPSLLALSGCLYWSSLYFPLALRFMIFPQWETLAEGFVPWEINLPKAKNPSISPNSGLSLALGNVLPQHPRASSQVVLGRLSVVCMASPDISPSSLPETYWLLSRLDLYVACYCLPTVCLLISVFVLVAGSLELWVCLCSAWDGCCWSVKYGWSEQGRVWCEKYCNLLISPPVLFCRENFCFLP